MRSNQNQNHNRMNPPWTPAAAAAVALCLVSCLLSHCHDTNVHAFSMVRPTTPPVSVMTRSMKHPVIVWANPTNDEEEQDNDDNDEEFDMLGKDFDESRRGGKYELPSLKNLGRPKERVDVRLGIPLELNPMSPAEAAELKAEATELINDAFAERLDEIAKLRERFSREAQRSAKAASLSSDLRAQQASRDLQTKVDRLAGDFLSSTQSTRASTKLAAQADRNNIKQSRGLEIGSWGRLTDDDDDDGATVPTGFSTTPTQKPPIQYNDFGDPMPESFVASLQEQKKKNRIFVLADETKDPMAKALLREFQSLLQTAFPKGEDAVTVEVVNPNLGSTAVPFGANNAPCAIVFATSLSQGGGVTSLKPLVERMLRRTALPGGAYGTPPTHLVCISTVGTERTNQMPYNLQNIMGGKLTQRRQMEEFFGSTVQNRVTSSSSPALDYTILKFGNLIPENTNRQGNNKNMDLNVLPGDVLDGDIGIKTAANILLQAVAFQPYARNATLCATGMMSEEKEDHSKDSAMMWDDFFLRLDGPELFRTTVNANTADTVDTDANEFDRLSEYMMEWAELTFRQSKSLTTPVDVVPSQRGPDPEVEGVVERSGVRILFRSTKTGNAYQSFDEERTMESSTTSRSTSRSTTGQQQDDSTLSRRKKPKREGGVEVVMEQTTNGTLRVRARRCAMNDDTVIKEISEATILKRLEEALDVWNKQNNQT